MGLIDVDEGDAGALPCEGTDDGFAYPCGSTSDDDRLARQIGIYDMFRRPGDVHVHFLGTATLSFAEGIRTQVGDVFEI